MNWFKKYKIVNINHTRYDIMKRNFMCKWEKICTYKNEYQAKCVLHKLNNNTFKLFTHYCCVKPTNKKYVIENLEKIGYIPSCTFDSNQKYIYTSQNGYIYSTNNDDISKLKPNNYDTLYGIYCSNMDDLFLSIAAINDRNDYMQWFYTKVFDYKMRPLPNHNFKCDQETLEKFGWVNNSPNSYKRELHNKMSVENIIEMFYEKENNDIN